MTKQEEADAMDTLDHAIDLICDSSFLSIGDVRRGRGADGEVQATIFVNGLPPANQAMLLKGLQNAVASTLDVLQSDDSSIDCVHVEDDLVKVMVEGSRPVSIRLEAVASALL